jgi:hypothetical protein
MPDEIENISEQIVTNTSANTAGFATVITLFDTLKQSLAQIAQNPLVAPGAIAYLGRQIEQHITKNLKESINLTSTQREEFDKLLKKTTAITALAGSFASLSLKISQSTIELRKASFEMGKIAHFQNMPGGTGSSLEAAAYMRRLRQENTSLFTSEFAESYEEIYKRLNLKIPRKMGFENETQRETYVRDLATYNAGYGINSDTFIEKLLQKQATLGLNAIDSKKILDQLMTGFSVGKFGTLNANEVLDVFYRNLEGATTGAGAIDSRTATHQILRFMETAAQAQTRDVRGDLVSMPFGSQDLANALNMTQGLQDAKKGMIFGSLGKQIPTDENALVDTFKSLQQFVKQTLQQGGIGEDEFGKLRLNNVEDFTSSLDLMRKSNEAWGKTFGVLQQNLGLNNEDIRLLLKTQLPSTKGDISIGLENVLQNKDPLAQTEKTSQNLKNINELIRSTHALKDEFDALSDKFRLFLGENAPAVPLIMDILGTTVSLGAALLPSIASFKYLKGLPKNLPSTPSLGMPSGGLILSGGILGGNIPSTPVTNNKFGKVGKFMRGMGGVGTMGGLYGIGATVESLSEGDNVGEALGRGALTGVASLGGALGGAKLGAMLGTTIAPGIGTLIGGALGAAAGGLLADELFGEKDKTSTTSQSDSSIPKIRIQLVDSRDTMLADKTVKTDGQDSIRVTMSGVLRN